MNYCGAALLALLTFVSQLAAQTFVAVAHDCGCPPPGNSVSIIDAATNKITANIFIGPIIPGRGENAGHAFAATPNGRRLYVTTGGGVSVIDMATYKIIAQISDIGASNSLAMSPDGLTVYVGSGFDFIGVVDTSTNKTKAYIIPPSYKPGGGYYESGGSLAISPDGKRLYLAEGSGIQVFDTAINSYVTSIPVDGPFSDGGALAWSADGKILYFNSSIAITTIDTTKIGTATNPVVVSASPALTLGIALDPVRNRLYITDFYNSVVYAIDATPLAGPTGPTFVNNAKLLSVPDQTTISEHLGKIALSPDGNTIFVTKSGDVVWLDVIDAVKRTVTASVQLGSASPSYTYALAVIPAPKPVAISIAPQTVSLSVGQTQQFTASVLNDINTAVTWSITPQAGSLSAAGLYAPPSSITARQTVTVTATSVADPTKSASATITLTPPGEIISTDGILNAASMLQGAVAPGEIVNVYGVGFGPTDLVSWSPDDSGFVPTQVAGLRLLFDGIASPILYAGANQVRAVVPYEVGTKAQTQVQVEYQGQKSNPVTALVTAVAPGIFTLDSSGAGQAMLLNEDGSQNSPANPASTGSRVVFYVTGAGESNPPGVDGQVSHAPFPKPQAPVTAYIAGMDAEVLSVGGAPGSVAGLIRVCIRVPDGAPSGDAVPLDMSVGGIGSQPGVTLAVR